MTPKAKSNMNIPEEKVKPIEIITIPNFGMITFKANLSDQKVKSSIKKFTGCEIPNSTKIFKKNNISVAWMSSD